MRHREHDKSERLGIMPAARSLIWR